MTEAEYYDEMYRDDLESEFYDEMYRQDLEEEGLLDEGVEVGLGGCEALDEDDDWMGDDDDDDGDDW